MPPLTLPAILDNDLEPALPAGTPANRYTRNLMVIIRRGTPAGLVLAAGVEPTYTSPFQTQVFDITALGWNTQLATYLYLLQEHQWGFVSAVAADDNMWRVAFAVEERVRLKAHWGKRFVVKGFLYCADGRVYCRCRPEGLTGTVQLSEYGVFEQAELESSPRLAQGNGAS